MKRVFGVFLMSATLLAPNAWAQEVDADVVTARELAKQAVVAMRAKEPAEAEEKLRRAYELVRAPSIAYLLALAFEQQGKWVEASELYLEATRLDTKQGDAAGQQQAKDRAREAREKLLPRIPRLVVEVDGVEVARVSVEVNGRLIPVAALGVERLVDPGEIEVKGRSGDTSVMQKVAMAEGDQKSVLLRFENVEAPKTPGPKGPGPASDAITAPADEVSPLRLPGYISIGVGVAGGVAGLIFLVSASGHGDDRDAVASGCIQGTPLRCTEDQTKEIRSLEDKQSTANTLSAVAFGVGGVALATGATLLWLSGQDRGEEQARVVPWVGWRSAGVSCTF